MQKEVSRSLFRLRNRAAMEQVAIPSRFIRGARGGSEDASTYPVGRPSRNRGRRRRLLFGSSRSLT